MQSYDNVYGKNAQTLLKEFCNIQVLIFHCVARAVVYIDAVFGRYSNTVRYIYSEGIPY